MASRSNMLAVAAILGVLIIIAAVFIFTSGDDDNGDDEVGQAIPTVTAVSDATQDPDTGTPEEVETDEAPPVAEEEEAPTATVPEPGDPAPAPEPPFDGAFGFGTEADEDTIAAIDIDIPPSGEGLPEGSGTAEEGADVYSTECAACHGVTGTEGGIGPALVSEPGPWEDGMPRTIGSYWPYATTVWDYTYRAMPFDAPGSLEPDEVYAVTAYLLAENGIIDADEEMNAETLPQVEMPNQPSFFPCWPDECRDD